MNVVSAVANLQKERDYYEANLKEAVEIIKQITEGPGLIEYLHPYDLAEMLNYSASQTIDVIKTKVDGRETLSIIGKDYRQSVWAPLKKNRDYYVPKYIPSGLSK